jgi:hypothetical protein
LDAYVFASDATQSATDDALELVPATARAVLPMTGGRELYVALSDSSAIGLMSKIVTTLTISGLTSPVSYLAYGSTSTEAPFPTYGVVADYVGFVLLATAAANTVSVYEAALEVTGVVGAAMVSGTGTVTIVVEATSDSSTTLTGILDTVAGLTNASEVARGSGPVSGGAGFTTS